MTAVGRQPNGSWLARPSPSHANHALSRLVHELNASRIDEETDEDEGELTGMTAEAQHPDRTHPRSSQQRAVSPLDRSARHTYSQRPLSLDDLDEPEGSLAQSRRQKAARTIKRKTRRLIFLISYYLSRFMHDLGTTAVTYRPLQLGIY
ncbi:hypothetical protein GGI20_001319 [Coemansia sp. BCRC 34301]|nr:hypothetical protein GGI20_001319 [Coemansia sp. BCRC 34301]